MDECLPDVCARIAHLRHEIQRVYRQTEPVCLVANCQQQRRVNISFFAVPVHVQVLAATWSLIRESMNQSRVSVEVEDDGRAVGKEADPFAVGHAMGVVAGMNQPKYIDAVNKPYLK